MLRILVNPYNILAVSHLTLMVYVSIGFQTFTLEWMLQYLQFCLNKHSIKLFCISIRYGWRTCILQPKENNAGNFYDPTIFSIYSRQQILLANASLEWFNCNFFFFFTLWTTYFHISYVTECTFEIDSPNVCNIILPKLNILQISNVN